MRENARRLGVRYPIALDNEFATWGAWHNQYWPAKYLIDRNGHVRFFHFGEGEYGKAEEAIRTLLAERGGTVPPPSGMPDESPQGRITPETYLGFVRLDRNGGEPAVQNDAHAYTFPRGLLENELSFGGVWKLENERAVAGLSAGIRLQYRARDVFLVLTGKGTVDVLVDGKPERTVHVDGDRLYTLVRRPRIDDHLLELRFSQGLAAYAFTFG